MFAELIRNKSAECYAKAEVLNNYSLIPRPRQAFRHLQYRKVERACYLFLCEHNVTIKWRKFSEQAAFHILFNRLHGQPLVWTTIASHEFDTCNKLPGIYIGFFRCSGLSALIHNSTILSALMSLTWEKIYIKPSPAFPYCKQQKVGWGLGQGLKVSEGFYINQLVDDA